LGLWIRHGASGRRRLHWLLFDERAEVESGSANALHLACRASFPPPLALTHGLNLTLHLGDFFGASISRVAWQPARVSSLRQTCASTYAGRPRAPRSRVAGHVGRGGRMPHDRLGTRVSTPRPCGGTREGCGLVRGSRFFHVFCFALCDASKTSVTSVAAAAAANAGNMRDSGDAGVCWRWGGLSPLPLLLHPPRYPVDTLLVGGFGA
jgi:hypothetical protein